MKRCPACQNTYTDNSLNFCLADGTPLAVHESELNLSGDTEIVTVVRRQLSFLTRGKVMSRTGEQGESRKETLLKKSLDLVRSEADNEDAINNIVRQALRERFYELAFDGIGSMYPKAGSGYYFCSAVASTFEPQHWKHLSEDFADYCAQRVLAFPEDRSSALGFLGLYFLSRGKESLALDLWSKADERSEVDTAISETCDFIVDQDETKVDAALALVDLIQTKTIKAKTISDLTSYL